MTQSLSTTTKLWLAAPAIAIGAIALSSHANATPAHTDQIAPAGYCMYSNPVPPPGAICTQIGAVVGRFAYTQEFQQQPIFPNIGPVRP